MLALGIRYLTGYAVAGLGRDQDSRHEWPPHPGRVFMALAAAHFETGAVAEEREALEWLEEQSAPDVIASDADFRDVNIVYVPVNDVSKPLGGSGKKEKPLAPLQSMPLGRSRQPRCFHVSRPIHDAVHLIWRDAKPPLALRQILENLCAKVTRIGHSASLVQCWLADDEAQATNELALQEVWQPAELGSEERLRVASNGTLSYLETHYGSNGKLRPTLSLWRGYARAETKPDPQAARTLFDERLWVLQLRSLESAFPHLELASTLQVTARLREAVLAQAESVFGAGRMPHVIHGHDGAGAASVKPHLAYLPLSFVGREHADGQLLGLAIAVPRQEPEFWPAHREEIEPVRRAVGLVAAHLAGLKLGPLGRWRLEADIVESPPWSLISKTWTAAPKGARIWGSVTPVVFDRHPKGKCRADYNKQTADMIAAMCEAIGLPSPAKVRVTRISPHLGATPSSEMPKLVRKDGGERCQTHALIEFTQPVIGPLMLGAGRFRGYGLCKPLRWEGTKQWLN